MQSHKSRGSQHSRLFLLILRVFCLWWLFLPKGGKSRWLEVGWMVVSGVLAWVRSDETCMGGTCMTLFVPKHLASLLRQIFVVAKHLLFGAPFFWRRLLSGAKGRGKDRH